MNLFNLDQSTMGQLSWCTLRPDMSVGEVSHGAPFITINKSYLNRLNINITTHLVQKIGGNTVNCLKFDRNAWECVCVCVQQLF